MFRSCCFASRNRCFANACHKNERSRRRGHAWRDSSDAARCEGTYRSAFRLHRLATAQAARVSGQPERSENAQSCTATTEASTHSPHTRTHGTWSFTASARLRRAGSVSRLCAAASASCGLGAEKGAGGRAGEKSNGRRATRWATAGHSRPQQLPGRNRTTDTPDTHLARLLQPLLPRRQLSEERGPSGALLGEGAGAGP